MLRFSALTAMLLLVANSGWAYYYYTYFNSTSAPYTPIAIRYDLNTLTNNTVPFFVSSAGPATMYPGDSMTAIVSQMSAAANVWNNVGSSSIRLAYGGFFAPGTTQTAPGIQIEFSDEIPPGLLALSIPTVVGGLDNAQSGTFIPIYLSLMELPSDLHGVFNGPSYSEEFFVTLVHEFGHALGLQHTLTSSVMSTLNTSASSKASPLGADDIAGVSLLYPAGKYLSSVGSISGTVMMNGRGMNLASVVAITPNGQAIATLTNPDGTYQLNGLPTGTNGGGIYYYVYVHPLPPPVAGESVPDNIWPPKNSAGNFISPDIGFATQFLSNNAGQAQALLVSVTNSPQNINFNVKPVSSPGVASVRTYSYTQQTYVIGAPVPAGQKTTIAATGVGLLEPNNTNNVLTPGLSVGLLGSAAQVTNLRAYAPGNPFVAVDVMPGFAANPGDTRMPLHLLFSTPGNLYVLPSAFSVVPGAPPAISAVTAAVDGNGNPVVSITGSQFTSRSHVFFDGLPAAVETQTSTSLIVMPPPAPAGYTAAVAVFNPDGQSSLFLGPNAPMYTYSPGAASVLAANSSLIVSPSSLQSGGSMTVDVRGTNTNFDQNLTSVGFGTSDVTVNQINVISPTHLTLNVTPNVNISSANITITTGLEVISQAVGSKITATDSQQQ